MTKVATTNFGVSLNGVPIIQEEKQIEKEIVNENPIIEKKSETESSVDELITITSIADFVDSSKDTQYYIDRYYN